MGAKGGLDGIISDLKLEIHANCYDKLGKMGDNIRKVRNRRNESTSNGTMMNLLNVQNMC